MGWPTSFTGSKGFRSPRGETLGETEDVNERVNSLTGGSRCCSACVGLASRLLGLDRTANDGLSSLLRIDTMFVLLDISPVPRCTVTGAGKLY